MSHRPQPTRTLLGVGAAALVLVACSYLLAGMDLGALGAPATFAIAAAKAGLILFVFMELAEARPAIQIGAVASLLLFLLLVILATVDVTTRSEQAEPGGIAPPTAPVE